jgi:hypothetical protein
VVLRHCDVVSTIITCCCHDCSKHHQSITLITIINNSPTGSSPTSRHRTSHKLCIPAVRRTVQQHQRRTHPRTAPHCTRLHHSCQKAAQRIRTLTASVEQATLTNTAAVTGHGYHRRATERKEQKLPVTSNAGRRCQQILPLCSCYVPSLDSCCGPMLQGHSIDAN